MGAPARVIGVFAHPDDEIFCAGGSMAMWAAQGAEVMVVSATRGEAGQIRDARVAVRSTLGQVREAELRAACAHLGVRHVRLLDHRDGTLDRIDQRALAEEVTTILEAFAPDIVVTFGEDGAYGHPDHIAIGEATARAVASLRAGAWRSRTSPPDFMRSHFPMSRLSLAEQLAEWLVEMESHFDGTIDYGRALTLFAEESTTMRFASDDVRIVWYPPDSMIVEEGEPATSLMLILSGSVDVYETAPDGSQEWKRTMHEGQFFGELGVASGRPRSASVVAAGNVTCLVLSPSKRSKFEGRGAGVHQDRASFPLGRETLPYDVVMFDVTEHVDTKVEALAMHRTQYPISAEVFPRRMLVEMYGTEYFLRV